MSENFSYNHLRDEFTIYGVRYAGAYFRAIGGAAPVGAVLQIIGRVDGLVTIKQITTEIEARQVLKICQERERALTAAAAPDPSGAAL